MKNLKKILALILAVLFLLPALVGCEKQPGLYNWYGKRVKVDNVLSLTLDVGDGKKEYQVPFDTYYALFDYYRMLLGTGVYQDENGKTVYTSLSERTDAIKERIEDEMIEFYSLNALAEHYGVGLTEADHFAFEAEYKENLKRYLMNKNQEQYLDSLDEYTSDLYDTFFSMLGITEGYFKYSYLHQLLTGRIKQKIIPDLVAFAESNYFHIKQVLITFTKGDAKSESEASEAAEAALRELEAGADIDEVIRKYGSGTGEDDLYFDSNASIIGSQTNDTVSSFIFLTVSGLNIGDTSGILSGEYSDELGYFTVMRRLSFDEEMLFGESEVAKQIFFYPYIGATSYTTHYNEYSALLDAYKQNMTCVPVNEKVYKRINLSNMK